VQYPGCQGLPQPRKRPLRGGPWEGWDRLLLRRAPRISEVQQQRQQHEWEVQLLGQG